MITTEIEKTNLEAHVEICAVRYANLENKLSNLETRMDKFEGHLVEIKNSLGADSKDQYKTLISIGTAILGALVAGVFTLLVHLTSK